MSQAKLFGFGFPLMLHTAAVLVIPLIEKMLIRRLDYIKGRSLHIYSPQNYETYSASAIVYRKGKYLFLLATPDNQRAVRAIEKLI